MPVVIIPSRRKAFMANKKAAAAEAIDSTDSYVSGTYPPGIDFERERTPSPIKHHKYSPHEVAAAEALLGLFNFKYRKTIGWCTICMKEFKRLEIHMRRHWNIKAFKCELCNAQFTQSIHLKRHHAIHEAKKTLYPCKLCKKRFSRKDKALFHERTRCPVRRERLLMRECSKMSSTNTTWDERESSRMSTESSKMSMASSPWDEDLNAARMRPYGSVWDDVDEEAARMRPFTHFLSH